MYLTFSSNLKVNSLMVKLRTPKASGALRKLTILRPVLRCKTRWSGAFTMVERYFQLKDSITTMKNTDDDPHQLEELMLKRTDLLALTTLFENMQKLNSVMLELQSPLLTLLTVRLLFDYTIQEFPTMASYLAPDANIVHSPEFEATLVKLHRNVCIISHFFYFIYQCYLLLLF